MTLAITSEIEQRITIQLNSGRYQSADKVILAALELSLHSHPARSTAPQNP